MSGTASIPETDEAFDRIEGTILPGIAITLDALLDAIAAGVPASSSAARAAELRTIALQLGTVIRQVENLTRPVQPVVEWPFRISA